MNENGHMNELEQATRRRLARLGSLPVDASALERALRANLPAQRRMALPRSWPLRAVAALLLVAVTVIAILVATSGGPVMASTAEMVRIHRDLVSGRVPIVKVNSIEEASEALSGKWPEQPGLPTAPESHIMACCMRSIRNRQVACVLFNNAGQPVTMSVARSSDLRSPQSPTVVRDGLSYHVESSGDLNMVSTQREGRWVCLIGSVPVDRLIDIAHGLRFQ